MLPCCPRTPKTQAWSRGVLLLFLIFYPLLLLISNNTSVGKASTVHITDFTQIPVWKCGDPGGMETPPKERYPLHWQCWWHCHGLGRIHRAFVTALSPQPSLLLSFHHPDQKISEKLSKDLVWGLSKMKGNIPGGSNRLWVRPRAHKLPM